MIRPHRLALVLFSVMPFAATSTFATEPQILYVNSCDEGCTFTPGIDDSSNNRSSIVATTVTLSEYQYSAASFDEVVDCLRSTFAPFAITVTEIDPAPTSHLEVVVAGSPLEAGFLLVQPKCHLSVVT